MPSDGTVADLKKMIKVLMDPELAHIAPNRLVVWKCPGLKVRGHGEDDKEFLARIHGVNFSIKEEAERQHEPDCVSSLSMPSDELLVVQMPGTYSHSILQYSNNLPPP
jgi:hypothetical protein